MKNKTNLLTALRKYRPRDNIDPLENFVTEAFAWLLINQPAFGRFYLGKILHRLRQPELSTGQRLVWETQMNLGGVFPDLVGIADGQAYLFEHKAWSPLHDNQLANYRDEATKAYGAENYRLILITGGQAQIIQNPDLGLCWHEVHAWISEWQQHKDYQPDHLFSDFQELLEEEGMGPPAPVSHESILAYRAAQTFEPALIALVQRVFHHPWNTLLQQAAIKPHLPWHRSRPGGQDPWGRIGINLLGDSSNWSPGLFAGFLVDPRDHCIEWSTPACPDFGLILDIDTGQHPNYEKLDAFAQLRTTLLDDLPRVCPDYQVLDHLKQSAAPNLNHWHPFHIRKPMLEVLRGTKTGDEQYQRVVDEITRLVKAVTSYAAFWEFRDALQKERTHCANINATLKED